MPSKQAPTTAHKRDMQELQAQMREKMHAASATRDLIIVHTGNGKGKSTAAFGMLVRNVGHKRRSVVVQFIKEGDTAIRTALTGPFLEWHGVGKGFTWDTQDREADIASAREGWQLALTALRDPAVRFVVLDELNVVLQCGYLPVAEVLAGLASRAPGKHVVITGRGAPPELLAAADLVTEMREVKHPFAVGVRAQEGVEF